MLYEVITIEGSHYFREIDILTSMKGLSVFTAIAIISDIISVKRFPNSVITSYSIHYTKLYEGAKASRLTFFIDVPTIYEVYHVVVDLSKTAAKRSIYCLLYDGLI